MDLLAIPPGPAIGEAIKTLLAADTLLDRAEAELHLRRWWAQRSSAPRP